MVGSMEEGIFGGIVRLNRASSPHIHSLNKHSNENENIYIQVYVYTMETQWKLTKCC
jgi:hypothetical protein